MDAHFGPRAGRRELIASFGPGLGNTPCGLRWTQMQISMVRVKRLSESATLPRYAHQGDSGLNLFSNEFCALLPGEIKTIGTGISIELPLGTEAQIRSRSGLAAEYGVIVLNSPGKLTRAIEENSESFSLTTARRGSMSSAVPGSRSWWFRR